MDSDDLVVVIDVPAVPAAFVSSASTVVDPKQVFEIIRARQHKIHPSSCILVSKNAKRKMNEEISGIY